MNLLQFSKNGGPCLGVKTESGVIDVEEAVSVLGADAVPVSMPELISQGPSGCAVLAAFIDTVCHNEQAAASCVLDESALTFCPCVSDPEKILCVGLNYREHAIEAGRDIPEYPVLFSKFNNALSGHNAPIPLPEVAVQFDYEAELVVIIGKRAKYVEKDKALDYVFGYCNGNDLSARDLQRRTLQWLVGKTLDKFMPIGPYLVTADDIDDPQNLNLTCHVNGELRQKTHTGDMIFGVAELIAYASQCMTLEPGDIISTGTPSGVILGMADKVWLRPGDEVSVEIDKLGRLSNVLVAEERLPGI